MLERKGYIVPGAVTNSAGKFLMKLKVAKNGRFGNAREARRLADAVIIAVSVKNSDLRDAIRKMEDETAAGRSVDYGFSNHKPAGRCANAF